MNHSAPLLWVARALVRPSLSLAHFTEYLLCSRCFTGIPSIKSLQRPHEVSAIITCFPNEKTQTSRDAAPSHQLTGVELQLKPRLDGQQSHHHDYSPGWQSQAPVLKLQEYGSGNMSIHQPVRGVERPSACFCRPLLWARPQVYVGGG